MSWNIKYTETALKELDSIHEYISETLLEPKIADSMIKLIMKEIRSLEELPKRHRLYEDEPWHSKGLRVLPVFISLPMMKTPYILSESCTAAEISQHSLKIKANITM